MKGVHATRAAGAAAFSLALAPTGPVALFGEAKVTELIAVLQQIRETAEVV